MQHHPLRILLFIVLLLSLNRQSIAQDRAHITLSVQLRDGMQFLENSSIFTDFEAAHPDIEINIIYKSFQMGERIPPPINDLSEHLDSVDTFTLEADILIMSVGEGRSQFSREATRAGYILDLSPLFNADSAADPSVYYPTVWRSVQWDGGLWMLPVSTLVSVVVYDPAAFDAEGLGYPDIEWTAGDFANAAEVLATRDAVGSVITPGFRGVNGSDGALAYQLLEHPLYDNSQFPYLPRFSGSDTLELANQWLPALSTGSMFNFRHDYGENFSLFPMPLSVGWISAAYLNNLAFAPLPNGGGLVNVNGFVVSSRTEYPQEAYELASYLAADIEVAYGINFSWGGTTLARPEYPDIVDNNRAPRTMPPPAEIEEEVNLLINEAITNGIPASELLYYPYFQNALWQAAEEDLVIETALRDAEILAMNNLAIAEVHGREITGTIPTPVPDAALASNEIELTFYLQEGDTSLWQAFADEFAANDPEIGRIIMQSPSRNLNYREEGTDCFYANASIGQVGIDYLLDLSPLITVDASLNPDDWLTGIFNNVQQGNSIYALPIDIRPLALWYERSVIEAAGLQAPQNSSELLDTLNALGSEGNPALSSYQLGTSLLMLIAAEGAVPINYQMQPMQIDFTSSENLAGMQRILDLARSGIIKYDSIIDFAPNSFPESEPFLLDYVANSVFRNSAYTPVVFPAGNQYTPVSYQIMAGFVSRFSQHPEACYRLLRSLSRHPELVNGLPALRSEALRSDYASFYDSFNQQLNEPNVLRISSLDEEFDYLATYWLFRAFDRYVLEDADLLAELSAAEQFTSDYLLCVEVDTRPGDCARSVDPSLSSDPRIGS